MISHLIRFGIISAAVFKSWIKSFAYSLVLYFQRAMILNANKMPTVPFLIYSRPCHSLPFLYLMITFNYLKNFLSVHFKVVNNEIIYFFHTCQFTTHFHKIHNIKVMVFFQQGRTLAAAYKAVNWDEI